MSGNGLQSLSKQIENLQHLTLLDLSNNELSEIPQEIGLPFSLVGEKELELTLSFEKIKRQANQPCGAEFQWK